VPHCYKSAVARHAAHLEWGACTAAPHCLQARSVQAEHKTILLNSITPLNPHIPCTCHRQKGANGLAVPRHGDIPPPPMFPACEEETPGPGYLTNSSGAGPSTGCACRPACSYERVSTRSCDQVAVQVSLKCSILVRQLTYTLMWSSRSTGVAEVLPSGSDAPGWW